MNIQNRDIFAVRAELSQEVRRLREYLEDIATSDGLDADALRRIAKAALRH